MGVEIINTITLNFATISLRADGIVNTYVDLQEAVTLEQAKELTDAYVKITQGKRTPHLFTANKFAIIEKDVMEFMRDIANKYGKADAFVISELPQKIVSNFYLKFVKPQVPTKFFSSEEKAVEWLKEFL
jgi:fructose-1-phosphate kinase PfkB-like protein